MVAAANLVTFAIPKGTLFKPTYQLLEKIGLNCDELKAETRQMVFEVPEQGVRYIVCRPTDIPTYVEYGAADLGLVGKDTIVEQQKDVYELLDLKYGGCRFVVAVPEKCQNKDLLDWGHARVATKFPRVAQEYFRSKGLQMEIVKLHGNIELAPIVGLAEMIVDIVSTGRTLKENNLVIAAEVMHSTSRLIANRVSVQYKANRINELVDKIRDNLEEA